MKTTAKNESLSTHSAPHAHENLSDSERKKDREIASLQSQLKNLQHQLDWYKRQVFGEKSEKRNMDDNPYQTTIADILSPLPQLPDIPTKGDTQTVT